MKIIKRTLSTPLGIAFVIAFVMLFLFSPDSYTHDLFGHYDSAWFFTCGKAWMNGLVPYDDFADSKGPLLWLIYGVGYLFTPHSYIGVFWLSVFLYTGIFYYVYHTAHLFLANHKLSVATVMIMAGAYFCAWYHTEIRAEDWCCLFVAMSLYHVCRLLFGPARFSTSEVNKACCALGIGMAGTLLIKFNMTIMLGTTALYVLYALIREKKNILIAFLSLIAGFACITMPFVIYMFVAGNFSAFVQEYFLNTMQTVQSYNGITTYIHEWLFLTYDPHYVVLFVIGTVGAYQLGRTVAHDRWFFLISFIGFYSIAIHHSSFLHWHYLCACMFFVIWACIALAKKASHKTFGATTTIVVAYTLVSNVFSWAYVSHTWFFTNSKEKKNYYEAAYYISQVENPTIMFYRTLDNSQGVPSGCLPATKYWAFQMGATAEMTKEQDEAIIKQKADFVVTSDNVQPIAVSDSLLSASGYHCTYSYDLNEMTFYLYSKHTLQPLPENFSVGSIDILLKRDIFNK